MGEARAQLLAHSNKRHPPNHQQPPEDLLLLETLAANILTPAFCSSIVAGATPLLAGATWLVGVPALHACCVVGALGLIIDWLLLGLLVMPATALYQRYAAPGGRLHSSSGT